MAPEEHYRRMMSALNEHGSYEEQQQRLYQLANSMGVSSHAASLCCAVFACSPFRAHLHSSSNSFSWFVLAGAPPALPWGS
ncbi:sterile alpha motif domain-containing protein 11-like [Acipenser oxyrinchus oxyrinchus]|uniref:Sterile alpha motif domain-containing protein 11-like n=1 Tax=Acipenser oxyrinchus oxyrinchus TaxID=40147 RepID=A0AAD8FRV4_ACIOX|nr:sterile alpha motif domain-containing protein 11-like [Acipenser oxyrinchus oxyrinchus]